MKRAKVEGPPTPLPKRRPGLSLAAREGQMIALAMDVAERRMLDNTASSQEVVHFLKLGSTQAQLEKERLENENLMLKAKIQAYESRAHSEEKYIEAMKAFSRYSGANTDNNEDEYDDFDY